MLHPGWGQVDWRDPASNVATNGHGAQLQLLRRSVAVGQETGGGGLEEIPGSGETSSKVPATGPSLPPRAVTIPPARTSTRCCRGRRAEAS